MLDEDQQPVTDPLRIIEIFCSYFSDLDSPQTQTDGPVSDAMGDLNMLEANSFTNEDQILDTDIIFVLVPVHFCNLLNKFF